MNTGTVYVGGSHTIQCRTYLGSNPGFWITKSKPTHTLTLKYASRKYLAVRKNNFTFS